MDATEEVPAVIQVPITISQEAVNQKPIHVKRKTRHHELVEVDGFVFRRKRKAITPMPAQPPAAMESAVASPAAIKLGLQFDAGSPAAAHVMGDNTNDDAAAVDQAAAANAPADAVEVANRDEQGPPDAAAGAIVDAAATAELEMVPTTQDTLEAPKPQFFSMAPSELIYMVEWVLISQLKKLPGMTADSAQTAAAEIKEQLTVQLQHHQAGRTSETTSGQAAADEQHGQQEASATSAGAHVMLLPFQVQQLKAALQDKHRKLLQEEAAWLQLRQQYSDMDQSDPAVEVCDHEKQPESSTVAAATPDIAEQAAGVAAAVDPPHNTVGPVTAQGESTLRGVSLKVEVLTALVAKMEHLISSAEAAARSLQIGYHNQKFKVFPHINSPAALIKSITQSQLSNP